MRMVDGPRPAKKPLLFATVGAILPFDRLVAMVAEVNARGEIPRTFSSRLGRGRYAQRDAQDGVETLSFDEMQATLKDADIVVCHAGIRVRRSQRCGRDAGRGRAALFSLREVYDDHQAEITQAFADRGLLKVANTADELSAALKAVREMTPQSATSDPSELIAYLKDLLATLGPSSPAAMRSRAVRPEPPQTSAKRAQVVEGLARISSQSLHDSRRLSGA